LSAATRHYRLLTGGPEDITSADTEGVGNDAAFQRGLSLTVAEVARRLELNDQTVRNWIFSTGSDVSR
jgi:hypothetical protein